MTIDLYMGDRMLHNENYRKAANKKKKFGVYSTNQFFWSSCVDTLTSYKVYFAVLKNTTAYLFSDFDSIHTRFFFFY